MKLLLAIVVIASTVAALPAPGKMRLVARQDFVNTEDINTAIPMQAALKGSPKKPYSTRDITAQFDKSAKRRIIRWGPFTLGPANGARVGGGFDSSSDAFNGVLDGICNDCMILSGSTYLTYENGSRADVDTGVYNHHVAVSAVGKRTKQPFACDFPKAPEGGWNPSGKPLPKTVETLLAMEARMSEADKARTRDPPATNVSMIFGGADDGAPIIYGSKDPSLRAGFYVAKSDILTFFSEFINYRNYTQNVYMTFEIEHITGKPQGWDDAMMGTLSALGCSMAYIPPDKESHTIVSPEYTVTVPGKLYNLRGHLHDGGINVRVHVNGKLYCESKAIYSEQKGSNTVNGQKWDSIRDYTTCPHALELKKGDKIIVDSTYDLSAHSLRPGTTMQGMGGEAMGLMAFSYALGPPK